MKKNNLLIYGISALAIGGGLFLFLKKPKGENGGGGGEPDVNPTETSIDNPWSANNFLAQTIPARTNILTPYGSSQLAKKLYDALENWFFDDAVIAVGIFTALPSKVQVAQVVKSFEATYNRNILEFLKNGKKTFDFWTGGISEEEYNKIIENVKRKPKF